MINMNKYKYKYIVEIILKICGFIQLFDLILFVFDIYKPSNFTISMNMLILGMIFLFASYDVKNDKLE